MRKAQELFLLIFMMAFLIGTAYAESTLSGIEPASDVLLRHNDVLWVSFKAQTGGTATFQLAKGKEFPMIESPDRPGFYTGAVPLSLFPAVEQAELSLKLKLPDRETTEKGPGKISTIPENAVLVGTTIRNDAILRGGPGEDFIRLGHLPQAIRLQVTGKIGQWYRVLLSGERSGFFHQDEFRLTPPGTWPSRSILSLIRMAQDKDKVRIRMNLSERCAFLVRQVPDPPSLTLELHGCASSLFETIYDIKDTFMKLVQVDQPSHDVTRVQVTLSRNAPGGYSLFFEDKDLILDIRRPLKDQGLQNLKGVKIIIDPGHGGSDSGAVGVYGTREKDANLGIARELRNLLLKAGADVVMTRDKDIDVTSPQATAREELEARVNIGKDGEGHLFVSIHHNAMASIEAARKARGTFVYFYHPQSCELARKVVNHLAPSIGEGRFTIIARSFAVIRQTYMPSILVEVAFISNPREELRIRQGAFRKRAAIGILKGIRAFVEGN